MHESPKVLETYYTQLELTVRNHPGVMSHICGLFARRAFNVEGILCMPLGTGEQSRIWLLLHEDQRLDQIMKQVSRLEDVLELKRSKADSNVFLRLEEFLGAGEIGGRGMSSPTENAEKL